MQTALGENESLKRFNITVATLKGDVRLIGTLESQTHIDEAIRITRATAGVHTGHNQLTIQ